MQRSPLDERTAARVAELFRAFSDTSRVRILACVVERETNVSQLAARTEMSESAVSHHLRGLRQLGLVTARRDGKEVFYAMPDTHLVTLFEQGIRHIRER